MSLHGPGSTTLRVSPQVQNIVAPGRSYTGEAPLPGLFWQWIFPTVRPPQCSYGLAPRLFWACGFTLSVGADSLAVLRAGLPSFARPTLRSTSESRSASREEADSAGPLPSRTVPWYYACARGAEPHARESRDSGVTRAKRERRRVRISACVCFC